MPAWLQRILDALRPYPKHIDPRVITCANAEQAETAARTFAAADPLLTFHPVADTGSMQPLIPKEHCFLVSRKILFSGIRLGSVALYEPSFDPGKVYCHRLVAKDASGYVASGDNNPRSESWDRVTPGNFRGEVVSIWIYPKPTV